MIRPSAAEITNFLESEKLGISQPSLGDSKIEVIANGIPSVSRDIKVNRGN